jgi:hypothetical protein
MSAAREAVEKLSSKQVADLLGVTEWSLRAWREKRVGPPYVRQVGRIYYLREDIRQWQLENRRS